MSKFDEFWDKYASIPVEGDAEAHRQHAIEAWIHSGKKYADFNAWWEVNAFTPAPGEEGAKEAAMKVWTALPVPV